MCSFGTSRRILKSFLWIWKCMYMHIFEGGGVRVGRPCLRPCSHNFSPPGWTVVIWDLGFYDKGKGSMWEASENFVTYVGVREGWCKNKQAHVCGPSPHPYATLTHTHTYTHNTHTQILGQSIEYRLCYQVCLDSWVRPQPSYLNSTALTSSPAKKEDTGPYFSGLLWRLNYKRNLFNISSGIRITKEVASQWYLQIWFQQS